MIVLFVHQNFPGQFKNLAPALADRGDQVFALTMRNFDCNFWNGVRIISYSTHHASTPNIHHWVRDFETKSIRGEACFHAALQLKYQGFYPDIIIAHPGWGESLFLKEVWPKSRLGIYCEFFYNSKDQDVGFDAEFPQSDPGDACKVRLKNLNNLLHFDVADAGISPTNWQASTFPHPFRSKISVIHDGIDTQTLLPNPNAGIILNNKIIIKNSDEVVTFVNRNLEPYRGYHIFMRSIPFILKNRPKVRILIIGGDKVSYGPGPEKGKTWKDIFAAEVRPLISDNDWSRVHFLGNIPYNQFISILQISTVHVYLTYPFVLSWSLLEAMSVGCAIVASDTQPLKEVIKHGESGYLVNFFDVAGLASEICTLLDAPDTRRRIGENARSFTQSNFDLAAICLPRQIAWVDGLKD